MHSRVYTSSTSTGIRENYYKMMDLIHHQMNGSSDGMMSAGEAGYGHSEPWIFANLYLFYLPICVVLGLSGNAMVWILIKSNRMLSRLPTNTYLLCLAMMSSMFLVFLLVFWLEEVSYRYFNVFNVLAFKNYNVSCKINTFLAHVCDFSSVWLIVLVCCERLVLLYRKRRSLTKERARLQVIVLICIAMLFNSWIILVASLNDVNQECDIDLRFVRLYNVMTILETIVCMMVPTIFIVISNILVRYKLNYHLKNLPGSPGVSFNTADVVVTTASSTAPSQPNTTSNGGRYSLYKVSTRASDDVIQPMMKVRGKKGIRPSDIQLTRSLLVVTSVFILLNLPNYLYRIANTFNLWSREGSYLQEISWLVHVLLYTHHALLFYLYIFYSPQMKRRLLPTALKLLECYCFKPPGDMSSDS